MLEYKNAGTGGSDFSRMELHSKINTTHTGPCIEFEIIGQPNVWINYTQVKHLVGELTRWLERNRDDNDTLITGTLVD